MPAWVGPAIAAGGALLSGYLQNQGASAQADAQIEAAQIAMQVARETNDMNAMIAAQNRLQAAEMFKAQMEFAIQQRNDERLGGFDAAGNRTYWHPERGWVTELTPTSERIQDASERQQILDRTILDRQQRERVGRQEDLQREDYRDAESQRDALRHVRQPSEQAIADLLFSRGEQGRADARDDSLTQLLRTQSRQGNTSNIPEILSETAGQSGRDAQTAATESQLQGMQLARQMPAQERSNRANLYSVFRDRATQPLGAVTNPAAAMPTGNFPQLNAGSSEIASAFNRGIPEQPFVQPDFSATGLALAEGNAAATKANSRADMLNNLLAITQTDAFSGFTDWLRNRGNQTTPASYTSYTNNVPRGGF